jgi:hypothetical protein
VIELGGSILKAIGGLPLTTRDIERLRNVEGLAAKLPAGCLDAQAATDAATDAEEAQESEDAELSIADGSHSGDSLANILAAAAN